MRVLVPSIFVPAVINCGTEHQLENAMQPITPNAKDLVQCRVQKTLAGFIALMQLSTSCSSPFQQRMVIASWRPMSGSSHVR